MKQRRKYKGRRKIFRTCCCIVSALGFLFLIGTAGASDNNMISLGQMFLQSVIGLAMFVGGGTLGGIIEW